MPEPSQEYRRGRLLRTYPLLFRVGQLLNLAVEQDAGTGDCRMYDYPGAGAASIILDSNSLGTLIYPNLCNNAISGDIPGEFSFGFAAGGSPADSSPSRRFRWLLQFVSPLSPSAVRPLILDIPASVRFNAACTVPTGSVDCSTVTTGFVCGSNGVSDVCQFTGQGGTCLPIAEGGDVTCLPGESQPVLRLADTVLTRSIAPEFGCDPIPDTCELIGTPSPSSSNTQHPLILSTSRRRILLPVQR